MKTEEPYRYGKKLFDKKQYKEAIPYYEEYIISGGNGASPNYEYSIYELAFCLFIANQYERALKYIMVYGSSVLEPQRKEWMKKAESYIIDEVLHMDRFDAIAKYGMRRFPR